MERLLPPVPEEEAEWLREVLARWAEAEPEAATAWLRAWSRHDEVPSGWVAAGLGPLAKKDLRAALLAERYLSKGSNSGLLISAAESNPAATMAFIEQHPQFDLQAGAAFTVWLQRDPAAACAWLTGSSFRNETAIRYMVADLAAIAPDRLPGVLAAFPEGSEAREAALASLAAWEVDRDPAAVLTKLASLTEEERRRMMEPLTRQLAVRGKPEEITRFLATLKGEERSTAMNELGEQLSYATAERTLAMLQLPGLTEMEIASLFQHAEALGPGHADALMASLKSAGVSSSTNIARFWERNLQRQPEETIPVLRAMVADGRVDSHLLMEISVQMSWGRNSAGLSQMIATLPEAQRAGPQAILALKAALVEPSADLSAYTTLTDAAARQAILRSVFDPGYGPGDSRARAAFVRQLPAAQGIEAIAHMPYEQGDGAAFAPVLEEALRTDPEGNADSTRAVTRVAGGIPDATAAMQWLDSLPAGAARDTARPATFQSLVNQDAVAASTWLDAQPAETPQRDRMVQTLTMRIVESDPESAWQWAGSIKDAELRARTQEAVKSRWPAAGADR